MQQIHQPSYYTDWELVPGASGAGALGEYYFINDDGYRGEQRSLKKQPGVKRVIALGDSFTYGMGVNLEDTYPKQLEAILNRNGKHYEVLNFGVIGYNMWQYNETLTRKALSYQPEVIILGLFQDDLQRPRPVPNRRLPHTDSDHSHHWRLQTECARHLHRGHASLHTVNSPARPHCHQTVPYIGSGKRSSTLMLHRLRPGRSRTGHTWMATANLKT